MVDWNNLTVTDVPPGSINGSEADTAREHISESLKQERPEPPQADKQPPPGKIAKNLSKLYGTIGMSLYPFDPQCATTILENSETMAKSLEDLAKENAAVKRVLEKLAETSAWGTVFAAHAPMVLALATHHGPSLANRAKQSKRSPSHAPESPPSAPSPGVGQYVPPPESVNEAS